MCDSWTLFQSILSYTSLYNYGCLHKIHGYMVIWLFKQKTTANTSQFFIQVIEEIPFPIQRIQTDRDRKFFAHSIQKFMMKNRIKLRSIKPCLPQSNGYKTMSQ